MQGWYGAEGRDGGEGGRRVGDGLRREVDRDRYVLRRIAEVLCLREGVRDWHLGELPSLVCLTSRAWYIDLPSLAC